MHKFSSVILLLLLLTGVVWGQGGLPPKTCE